MHALNEACRLLIIDYCSYSSSSSSYTRDDFDEIGRRLASSQLLLNKSFVGAVQRCMHCLMPSLL